MSTTCLLIAETLPKPGCHSHRCVGMDMASWVMGLSQAVAPIWRYAEPIVHLLHSYRRTSDVAVAKSDHASSFEEYRRSKYCRDLTLLLCRALTTSLWRVFSIASASKEPLLTPPNLFGMGQMMFWMPGCRRCCSMGQLFRVDTTPQTFLASSYSCFWHYSLAFLLYILSVIAMRIRKMSRHWRRTCEVWVSTAAASELSANWVHRFSTWRCLIPYNTIDCHT